MKRPLIVSDGFGNEVVLCGVKCSLHVVRPGKFQCDRSDMNCFDRGDQDGEKA